MSKQNVVNRVAVATVYAALGAVVALSLSQAFTTAAHHPGDVMQNGTVYAGLSPRTLLPGVGPFFIQEPLYVTPQDAPGAMAWREAQSYCDQIGAHGHKDWRLPDHEDLNLIFENSAAIGGFNTSGSFPAGWYWSSSEFTSNGARVQRFSDGTQSGGNKDNGLSVRCVRG